MQYLELYNEVVNDLLDPTRTNLEVRENRSGDVFVDNLSTCPVNTLDDFLNLLSQGESNRKIAETAKNK